MCSACLPAVATAKRSPGLGMSGRATMSAPPARPRRGWSSGTRPAPPMMAVLLGVAVAGRSDRKTLWRMGVRIRG
eukprot:8290443-Lingulodinium_polyedra.AAC.1